MHKILTNDEIRKILSKRFQDDTCNCLADIPSPNSLKDIERATLRIVDAIEKKEKIAIVGDYDVDGVVASVVLSEFFDDLNVAYSILIPNRFSDGYGLNPNIVKRVDANLIITVDNGISAIEAADFCNKNSIDLIITDHHEAPPTLPDAYAIVNPKQLDCNFPNSEICGAQVAWYLVANLKEKMGLKYNLGKFLDILSVAIMADMMELKDMNRVMVKKGIKNLSSSKRVPFIAIKKYFAKETLEGDDISFLIAPLINSSGRMEEAILSYEFLKSKNLEDAIVKLEYIVSLNNMRKDEEKTLFDASLKQINEDENIVIVWGEDWHEGVIGIVASRLSKKFKKPSIVFSINGEIAKASARSVGDVDILLLISMQKELLLRFGGHKNAAGLSIKKENLNKFKTSMVKLCKDISKEELEIDRDILGEIDIKSIDFKLLDIIDEFEPYGQKNQKPIFILKNVFVKEDRVIGRDKRHLKLTLSKDNYSIEALFFNYDVDVKQGDTIDILFTVFCNKFRGLATPQLLIKQVLNYF
ncbi:MAG: single-stranded-DNA-specific exonuclease RecJ [Sulfurospirillum sp.]|nr:single-stranded-DNA-specific exonuclease RecJ [Sulfurospirillum sp.]